jgi:uncharacterized phiE125 gp8 family phage protein
MTLTLITPPAVTPVSAAEMKRWLRIDDDEEQAEIEAMIGDAVDHVDGWSGILGRAMIEQTWELTLDAFPACDIQIPLGPLIGVTSIKYDDPDGIEQTLSASAYEVDNLREPGWVVPVSGTAWPSTIVAINAVRVRFTAGFGNDAASVPGSVKRALRLLIAHWYQNREGASATDLKEIPMGMHALLGTKRRIQL